MLVNNLTMSTDMFHYDKKERLFTQEASTLQVKPGQLVKTFILVNPKTEKKCYFRYNRALVSHDEIQGWEYKNKELGIHLVIWND